MCESESESRRRERKRNDGGKDYGFWLHEDLQVEISGGNHVANIQLQNGVPKPQSIIRKHCCNREVGSGGRVGLGGQIGGSPPRDEQAGWIQDTCCLGTKERSRKAAAASVFRAF